MLKLIIFRFWPVFIPVILYLLWRVLRKRKGEEASPIVDERKHWFWVAVASLALLIISFLIFGLTTRPNEGVYEPARVEDGKLIPGRTR